MVLRIGLRGLIVAAVLLIAVSSLCGFLFSRYLIDLELRRTDAAVMQSARDLDRYEVAMAQQIITTTQAIKRKIDALQPRKEQRH